VRSASRLRPNGSSTSGLSLKNVSSLTHGHEMMRIDPLATMLTGAFSPVIYAMTDELAVAELYDFVSV